jgi:hypothetical protein
MLRMSISVEGEQEVRGRAQGIAPTMDEIWILPILRYNPIISSASFHKRL